MKVGRNPFLVREGFLIQKGTSLSPSVSNLSQSLLSEGRFSHVGAPKPLRLQPFPSQSLLSEGRFSHPRMGPQGPGLGLVSQSLLSEGRFSHSIVSTSLTSVATVAIPS